MTNDTTLSPGTSTAAPPDQIVLAEAHDLFLATRRIWAAPLTAHQKLVYLYLYDRAGRPGQQAWPGYDRIAADCALSRRKVISIISDLERMGYIERRHRFVEEGKYAGQQRTNIYVVHPLPTLDAAATRKPGEGAQHAPSPRVHGVHPEGAQRAPRGCTPCTQNAYQYERYPEGTPNPLPPAASAGGVGAPPSDELDTTRERVTGPGAPRDGHRKPPDPRVRAVIQRFCERHRERYGVPAVIRRGKDGALIRSLPPEYDADTLLQLVDEFFAVRDAVRDGDPWLARASPTIGVFVTQVPKLVARRVRGRGRHAFSEQLYLPG